MNILDTFIGVLLAFIVKDFYDIFITNHVKNIFSNYKSLIKSKNPLDKEIIKLAKAGKLKLTSVSLNNDNDKKIKEVKKNVSRTNKTKNA